MTGRLNEQVKRNQRRFPEDFASQLTQEEFAGLMSQNAISNTPLRSIESHAHRPTMTAQTEDTSSQGIAGRSVAVAGGALLGYGLLAWLITQRFDLRVFPSVALGALGFSACAALVQRLGRGTNGTSRFRSALLGAIPSLVGSTLILLNSTSENSAPPSAAKEALGPLAEAMARNAIGLLGVSAGCLLAGVLAALFVHRASIAQREIGQGIGTLVVHFVGWTISAAIGGTLFFYLLS